MRAAHGSRWLRSESAALNAGLRQKMATYEAHLQQAAASDAAQVRVWIVSMRTPYSNTDAAPARDGCRRRHSNAAPERRLGGGAAPIRANGGRP